MTSLEKPKYLQSFFWLKCSFFIWASMSFVSNSALSLHHIFAVLAFLCYLGEKPKFQFTKSQLCLFILWIALVASVIFNWQSLEHPFKNLRQTKYILIGVLLVTLVSTHKQRLKAELSSFLALFLLSFSVANVYGIINTVIHCFSADSEYRLSGFFGMVMSFAYLAVFPFALIFFLLIHPSMRQRLSVSVSIPLLKKIYSKKTLICLFLLSLIAIFLTLTRGAVIGALIAGPILLISKSKKVAIISGGFSASIFLVGAVVAFSNINLKSHLFLNANNSSHGERVAQFKMAWTAFEEHPVFGIGYRSFEEKGEEIKLRNNIPHADFRAHAHNNLLEILGSAGVFGFLSFCAWLFFWFQENLHNKLWRSFILTSIITFLVTGLFQSTFIDSEYTFTLLALYSLTPLFLLEF